MSSKKPTNSTPSITLRLTVLYLAVTLATLVLTLGFLHRTLEDDLEFEDTDFLNERIASIQSIIARHPDTSDALKEHLQIDQSHQHTRYLVRVQDAHGNTILETPGMATIPSVQFPPPVISGQPLGRAFKYREGASHYLLNAAWAEKTEEMHFRLVQVALDVTDEEALMAKYRFKAGIALPVGLFLAGVFGIIVTRKGLKPLQEMAVICLAAVPVERPKSELFAWIEGEK